MNRPPLIIHTDWSRSWGGQEIRTITELGEMKKLGFRTALFVRPGAELAKRAEAEGVPVYFVDFSSKFRLSAWLRLFRLICSLKPAVVNTHSSEDSWMAGSVARLCRVPLVIKTRHVLASVSSSVSYNLFSHVIWACSESIREQLISNGVRAEKIIVQSTGIDEERFCFSGDDRLEIREKYGIRDDDILVGNVSFLRHYKGHDFIIRTAATMKEDKRFKFIFVGGGDDRSDFEKKAKSVGVDDRIIFTGHREDTERFFAAIDIVFFASYETVEGISQSFIQGLLYGIPLLTCRSPSLMEPLEFAGNYVTVGYNDLQGAKKGLLELSRLLERDELQIEKQRKDIARKYGLTAMMKNIIRVYGEYGVQVTGDRRQVTGGAVLSPDPELNKPELLAPAGSYAAFEAAVEQGADAVYVGTPGFNARALSRDFTFAEIGFMIKEAHACGVRLFVAMNSIIKEDELKGAVEALSILGGLRPDALIIQDQGLLFIARKWFPEIPLHASTLMAANNSLAVQGLTDLGFSRVVLARELTIDEIGRIHKQTGADIEVFVHGAMCFSYSGLCMFSSLHGGKSSLRGQCVQPCRRDYAVVESLKRTGKGHKPAGVDKEKRKYFFSMHDLCAIDVLPELRDAGVGCLKIEGRLKSASYVANCVSAYRMALDCMDEPLAEQERVLREAHRLLDAAMARKRSSGYMFSKNPVEAVSPEISGSSGQLLGRVEKISFAGGGGQPGLFKLLVPLTQSVSVGDRVRFNDDRSGVRAACTLRFIETGGRRCKQAQVGDKVWLGMQGDLKSIDRGNFSGSLYRVDVKGRINIERKGVQKTKHLKGIRINPDGNQVYRILQELGWRQSRERLNNPVKRERPSRGRQDYGRKEKRTGAGGGGRSRGKKIPCWLGVRNIHDLKQRLPFRAARLLLPLSKDNMRGLPAQKGVVKKNQARIIWQLPPVIEEADLNWFRDNIRKLISGGFHRFELGHLAQHELFSEYKGGEKKDSRSHAPAWERKPAHHRAGVTEMVRQAQHSHAERGDEGFAERGNEGVSINLELFGNYNLNILNSAALRMVHQVGLRGVVFSLETESGNMKAALADFKETRRKQRNNSLTGLLVYGRPPLFTARLDLRKYSKLRQVESPREERFTVERGEGLTRVRSVLPFSLLHLQDEIVESEIDYMVFDLSGGPIKQEAAIVNSLLNNPGKRRQQVLSGNYHGVMV